MYNSNVQKPSKIDNNVGRNRSKTDNMLSIIIIYPRKSGGTQSHNIRAIAVCISIRKCIFLFNAATIECNHDVYVCVCRTNI